MIRILVQGEARSLNALTLYLLLIAVAFTAAACEKAPQPRAAAKLPPAKVRIQTVKPRHHQAAEETLLFE